MNEIYPTETNEYEEECECAAECSDINVTEEESTWNQTSIGCLLEECLKMKKDLHDPRHRRNKFFGNIRDQMIGQGYFFSAKALERKFHNLKKHFCTICQNKDRGVTSGRPITWPYYNKMMEIFAEELEIEDAPTMASLYPEPPPPKNSAIVVPKIKSGMISDDQSDEEIEFIDMENEVEETPWTHKAVVAFLRECVRKKYELWDPQIRRRTIFNDIRQRLKVRGFHFFQESLDRKLRNMKKHYQVVTESMQKASTRNSTRRRITWPYYEQLKEIYGGDTEKEIIQKRRGRISRNFFPSVNDCTPMTTSFRFRAIAPKTAEHTNVDRQISQQELQNSQIIAVSPIQLQTAGTGIVNKFESTSNGEDENSGLSSYPSTSDAATLLPFVKLTKIEYCPPSPGEFDRSQEDHLNIRDFKNDVETYDIPSLTYDNDAQESHSDFGAKANTVKEPNYIGDKLKFSLDILALEERRTIVAEKMVDELIEANRIREKRLQFQRIRLEYANAKIKRKKNGAI